MKALIIAFLALTALTLKAQDIPVATPHPLSMDSILAQGPEYDYIRPMVGKWTAVQTIYEKDGKTVMMRDTLTLERKMVGNFLQETMTPHRKNDEASFTRISYLNYNRTNRRWEYIVLDTRYPLMMFEQSVDHKIRENKIHLYLDNFIFPPFWGPEFAGRLAKQHRVITFGRDEETNEQYWTLPGEDAFLAIKYVLKRAE